MEGVPDVESQIELSPEASNFSSISQEIYLHQEERTETEICFEMTENEEFSQENLQDDMNETFKMTGDNEEFSVIQSVLDFDCF